MCGASLYQGAPGEVLLPPDRGRTSRPKDPWYTSPLLYGVGIVILLVIIGSVVAIKKSAKSYPALVLNQQSTLLDIYTDSCPACQLMVPMSEVVLQ